MIHTIAYGTRANHFVELMAVIVQCRRPVVVGLKVDVTKTVVRREQRLLLERMQAMLKKTCAAAGGYIAGRTR
jgi:hypothetical protein